jgi:hypothetical protein
MEDAAVPKSALGDFLSDLLTGKKVNPQKAGAAAAEVFEAFFRGAAANARPGVPPTWNGIPFPFGGNPPGGQRRAGAGPRQPPPLDDEDVKRLRARKLLGFTDKEPLTVEIIRKRQRELGKKFHPDLQPPDKRKAAGEKMAQVSGAAALLMDDLR